MRARTKRQHTPKYHNEPSEYFVASKLRNQQIKKNKSQLPKAQSSTEFKKKIYMNE